MGFLDSIFGKRNLYDKWEPTHRGVLKDISYDDIVELLGKPQRTIDGFVFWRGPLTTLDPEYPEEEYFQLSNKKFSGRGRPSNKGIIGKVLVPHPENDCNAWSVLGTSTRAIRILSDELGTLAVSIQPV